MKRHIAGVSGFLVGAMFAAPASFAQNSGPGASEASSKFDTIIVNARRREESLQDVPVAITAKSQEELDLFNIESLGDLQYFTPSFQLTGPYRDQPLPTIRGQGGFTPGGIPSVILYLNEVPSATSVQAGSPGGVLGGNDLLYDLENVQVLKGPQGTLFGRNTTGGAILVQSRRPDEEFGGYVQTTFGNFSNKEIDAAINVPLFDKKLLVRFALSGQDRDGFTFAESTPSHPDGLDLDDAEHISGRLSVLYRPSDRIENLLIADFIDSKRNGTSSVLVGAGPPASNVFPGILDVLEAQRARGVRELGAQSADLRSDLERWSITDIFTWRLTDNLTFKNIFSYQDAEYARTIDGDGTVFPLFDPIQSQDVPFETRQFAEEAQLQLSDAFDGLLDASIGFFYLDLPFNDDFSNHRNVIFGAPRNVGFNVSETSTALYAQADVDLSSVLEGLSFTGGFRYTWETIRRRERDVRIPSGVCTAANADENCVISNEGNFEAPTWTVGLNYQLHPDTLVYVASRRGFRSGGFNTEAGTLPDDLNFDEETVTDVEVGVKSDWSLLGANIRTNIAAYRQFYNDIQLEQFTPNPVTGGNLTVIRNAAQAVITGVELESRVFIGERLEIGGQFGWLDFNFTEFDAGVIEPIVTVPEWTYGVDGAFHMLRDERLGNISLRAAWNSVGDRFIAALDDPLAFQEQFGLLTLSANWNDIGGAPVDVSFFMTNALDAEFAIGGLPLSSALGTSTLTFSEPRMWGVRLGYRFGADR